MSIEAKAFFDRFGQDYIKEADKWIAEVTRREIAHELENYRTVAEAYNLQIPTGEMDREVIAFGTMFTSMMWEQY